MTAVLIAAGTFAASSHTAAAVMTLIPIMIAAPRSGIGVGIGSPLEIIGTIMTVM
jgi:hypothetical protein